MYKLEIFWMVQFKIEKLFQLFNSKYISRLRNLKM